MNTKYKRKKRSTSNGNTKRTGQFKKNQKRGKQAGISIDPASLVKKANSQNEEKQFHASRSFDEMPIHHHLKSNLDEMGFKFPTQIQEETLEPLLQGKDLVGIANTGTGKTVAFLMPIIEELLRNEGPKSLVVVPTRELAQQVEGEFKKLTRGMGLYSSCFIGGTSISRDLEQLQKRNDLIIGTPGRLMDLANRGNFLLNQITTLILDEFDRMLDMGFVNEIKQMVGSMTRRKQTMLFSATVDNKQKKLIDELLSDPIEIKVSSGKTSSDNVEQDIIRVPNGADKFDLLLRLVSEDEFEKVLVFTETKRLTDRVSKKLKRSGIAADLIHGDKSQSYRMKALQNFRKGKVRVLVATDVAARGIDVDNITHVINYQLPLSYDSYLHRVGRTGRAGKKGKALTLVD